MLTGLLPACQASHLRATVPTAGGRRESISKGEDGMASWNQLDEEHNAAGGSCQAFLPCHHHSSEQDRAQHRVRVLLGTGLDVLFCTKAKLRSDL